MIETGKTVEEGGLSGPVGPDDPDNLAWPGLETDISQSRESSERLG
jgi:hypothetical protein